MEESILDLSGIRVLAAPSGSLPGTQAVLTLRDGGVSEPPFDSLNLGRSSGDDLDAVGENERRLESALGLPGRPARAKLEHGTRCIRVARPGSYGPVDTLLTSEKGLPLWLTVADCLPVYLAAGDWIALLHAGWRGVAAGAVRTAADRLAGASGQQTKATRVWIGPGIKRCCYPVERSVAEKFPGEVLSVDCGKVLLDLTAAVRLELLATGIRPDFVHSCDLCTSCRPDLFFSYRRDGKRTGRMAALLWRI